MASRKPTIEQLAAAAGVSEKTLRRYKAQGVDIYSPDALKAHAAKQKNAPASLKSATLEEAKLNKINLECERIAHALEVERRKFVPIDEVRRDMIRIAAAQRAEDKRLVGEVGTWEGLSAADLSAKVRAWLATKCKNLNDQFSKLYTS